MTSLVIEDGGADKAGSSLGKDVLGCESLCATQTAVSPKRQRLGPWSLWLAHQGWSCTCVCVVRVYVHVIVCVKA